MKSEEDIEFRRKIAMLWHWRAIEGKKSNKQAGFLFS